jgi:hypothetical protein
VIYPGSTPVGNATLVVANVLTCNKHSPIMRVGWCVLVVYNCTDSVVMLLLGWVCAPTWTGLCFWEPYWHACYCSKASCRSGLAEPCRVHEVKDASIGQEPKY